VNDTNESTSVEMNCTRTVTAVFAPILHVLEMSADPGESGEIMVEPAPSTPDGYLPGTEVIMEAVASEGYQFSHWSGDATGRENPMAIIMGSDTQLRAHFVPRSPFPWWWLVLGIGAIGISLPVYLWLVKKPSVPEE